ncbi:uncharacterized protein N0V89_009987 [Didymosphaeria variabile]|uniref:Glycoside hydrolase family 2 protein n=1 Tax=Didymosphaeria variabile TaxID=1932322 RepID=A0A9W8XG62_9PLEO|nr:uncharacterized protein N0V89_009987 [Didymosphaeria variabile]KAJ4348609.1 hypothetical protein N0V89_009987 [Didymosphaeria variabile]
MASKVWNVFCLGLAVLSSVNTTIATPIESRQYTTTTGRERISIDSDWRFQRTERNPDGLSYSQFKRYVLPTANDFIKDASKHTTRPGNLGGNVKFVQSTFDDSAWENVTLPHDWAIKGPFYVGDNVPVKGGMGRLPIQGVGWYRKKLDFSTSDKSKRVYLDIDGAQSYAAVWLNGEIVGGWPYGYASFRLDLTPYLNFDGKNQLAIRLGNPLDSSRWYPGGGLYRNVWITKVETVHVAQWGTYVTTEAVSEAEATVRLALKVENTGNSTQSVDIATDIFVLDGETGKTGNKVASFPHVTQEVAGNKVQTLNQSAKVENPLLWGPWTSQKPNLYVAVTRLSVQNRTIDTYESRFGIRTLTYSGSKGLLVNGEHIRIQGVNQHHDLGALGAAFNLRAATRQLEILKSMGTNAIRMSHNPPAPELLDLTDRMGFLVMDEIFDVWNNQKTVNDFHLIFDDWHEADLRAFLRRDRNHPSIFGWSVGNEVSEQTSSSTGGVTVSKLRDIAHDEEPTRPITASMNAAHANQPFPAALDFLSLNYQGEGIRDSPAYSNLKGITTKPVYPDFHAAFPNKLLLSSETAAALSSRGQYIFPVQNLTSAPVNDTSGGNSATHHVSDYGIYSADFGSSPDKVFSAQDHAPYVAGEFVWSGFDYLGEPTPYYSSRSAYFGPIDLAGFPKDRYFLYKSRWLPNEKFAHILPHWNWPDRLSKTTPVHVFSSADQAELFVNGKSQGRKTRGEYEYRFRWDEVKYTPGTVSVSTFKDGKAWANATVQTTGAAARIGLRADRSEIAADGRDLSFVTADVLDKDGLVVSVATNEITFSVDGGGEIVATDNGDPTDFTVFPSHSRKAFAGKALVIVKGSGSFTITAKANGLEAGKVTVTAA